MCSYELIFSLLCRYETPCSVFLFPFLLPVFLIAKNVITIFWSAHALCLCNACTTLNILVLLIHLTFPAVLINTFRKLHLHISLKVNKEVTFVFKTRYFLFFKGDRGEPGQQGPLGESGPKVQKRALIDNLSRLRH